MNIGEVADLTGLPAKTIRYYEDIALIQPKRTSNGYRVFDDNVIHKLRFLGRARDLGFSIDACRTLLGLYEDTERESAQVKEIAEAHLSEIERKISELQAMHSTLKDLVRSCRGDDRPDCPILSDLSDASVKPKPVRRDLG